MAKKRNVNKKVQKTASPAKKDNRNMKIIIAVIFCFIIINAMYYAFTHVEGISEYGDDPTYTYLASALTQGHFMINPGYIFSVRLTEIFAIGFFYEIFGPSNFTSALWNLSSYIGIVIVTFFIVRYFYNNKAALLSSFLVSIFPLVTKYAVNIGEDIPLTFITSLAVLLFLYGERYHKKPYYFFSGMALVVAWLTSYESALVIVFILLYAFIELVRRKIKIDRTTLYFIYGIVTLFAVVFVYSYVNAKMPFVTITTNTRFYSAVGGSVNGLPTIPSADTNLSEYINAMFQYNLISLFKNNPFNVAVSGLSNALFGQILTYEYGLYFYLLIPIAIFLLIYREKRAYFLMFWFTFLWAGLEFGPMHVGITLQPLGITYLLAHRLLRFMLIVSVPLAGILGIGLAKLIEQKSKVLLAAGSVVLAVILIVLYLNNYYISTFWHYWQHYPAELVMQATNYLKTVNQSSQIYLEAYYNNAYVGYSEGPITTYLGNPSSSVVNYTVANFTKCDTFKNNSYIIWSGPPNCGNWVNVLNITTPKDIPDYIVTAEDPTLNYKPTNVYYIR